MNLQDFMNGTLLGDGSVRSAKPKYGNYFYYKLTAKDKRLLLWHGKILENFGIRFYITVDNKNIGTHSLGFYMNRYDSLSNVYNNWYQKLDGKNFKTVPKDLKLTPATLLFWYLGDGCLIRRKNDDNRIPFIVLATNCFSRNDIDFLITKLKELNLNFYPVKYKSGFTGKSCGYCLYSNTQDGTVFRFFQTIGFECPKEIERCITGRKGRYRELHHFKDKWPREDDWMKILSNDLRIGSFIKERRTRLGISRKVLTTALGVGPDYIRKVEYGRYNPSVKNFRKALKALNVDAFYMLKELRREG